MTLLHWAEFRHDCEHAARLSSTPDPLFRYPLFTASHALPEIVKALPVSTGWNLTVVAPSSAFKFVHIVLKWLHHLEEE